MARRMISVLIAAFAVFQMAGCGESNEYVSGGGYYPVTVNYDLPVEDAVRLDRYDMVGPGITSAHFPAKRSGEVVVVVELIQLKLVHESNISAKDALHRLDKMGMRPAELHELLAFGEKYPDIQRDFPVIALGSVWQDQYGDRRVPCLDRLGSERNLYLLWLENNVSEVCRFAAVRK